VQEARDLSAQFGGVQEFAHRAGHVEQFALQFPGQGIPLHDECGPKIAQDFIFLDGEAELVQIGGGFVRALVCLRVNCLLVIVA
jgi:hypothetical protein